MNEQHPSVPIGYCQCGCGQKTNPRERSNKPQRYVYGHGVKGRKFREGPEYVVDDVGCWVYQGYLTPKGYPGAQAHRLYFERAKGPIPPGLQLDHLCRNRACVNPDHLEAVTTAENTRRGANTKLTAEDVKAIRASSDTGVALAERYGVTPQAVSRVRKRLCWKDI